jgi:cysteine desulfurase / selenocysteine lyase
MDVNEYRRLFPITTTTTFLNHAAIGPLSILSREAVHRYYDQRIYGGGLAYPQWQATVEAVRAKAADLIGALPSEIAFVGNTSHALSLVAGGLAWRPGDNLIMVSPDFPSNIYPWLNLAAKGVSVRTVQRCRGGFDPAAIMAAADADTRLLTLSSVDYASGFAADLPALGAFCRRRGILFCVDAVQSLGVMPLDTAACGIDFLAAATHKWLLGPMGMGIFYVSTRAMDRISPSLIGWKSVIDEEDFALKFILKSDARKFEPGTFNLAGILGLGAALDLLAAVGIDRIYQQVGALTDGILAGCAQRRLQTLTTQAPPARSGIVAVIPPVDGIQLLKFMEERSVAVSLRNGHLRLSPHFYNDESDIERFFKILDQFNS